MFSQIAQIIAGFMIENSLYIRIADQERSRNLWNLREVLKAVGI